MKQRFLMKVNHDDLGSNSDLLLKQLKLSFAANDLWNSNINQALELLCQWPWPIYLYMKNFHIRVGSEVGIIYLFEKISTIQIVLHNVTHPRTGTFFFLLLSFAFLILTRTFELFSKLVRAHKTVFGTIAQSWNFIELKYICALIDLTAEVAVF